jgi:hypothetical protein
MIMQFFTMPLFIYQILFCLIISLVFIRRKGMINKLFPLFFLVLLGVEYYCAWLYRQDKATNHIYNVWFPVEYIFYSYCIVTYISGREKQKISVALIIAFAVFTVINYLFKKDFYEFASLPYLVGFVAIFVIILFKLYEILNQEIIYNPFKNEIFWFCLGILVVNIFGVFHFGAVNYMYKHNTALYNSLQRLNVYLTEFQYFCFFIYFLCKWKYQKLHI